MGCFFIMFIYPFKIELLGFCEEFLQIASLNSRLLINIIVGWIFCLFFLWLPRHSSAQLLGNACVFLSTKPKSHTSASKHQCTIQFSTLISAGVSVVPKSRTAILQLPEVVTADTSCRISRIFKARQESDRTSSSGECCTVNRTVYPSQTGRTPQH